MSLTGLIIAFILFMLMMASSYFYLFARSQELYVRYWGLCWLAYSFSLLFFILYLHLQLFSFLEFRKVFDLLNILYLLFGAYAFMHTQIPTYWHRFTLYLVIWLMIGAYYRFDLLSLYLPLSLYQIIITIALCIFVFRYWDLPAFEKGLSLFAFALWGTVKATLSLLEVYHTNLTLLCFLEVLASITLNFCIFIIYLQKTRRSLEVAQQLYRIIAENATDVIFYYKLHPFPAFSYLSPSVETLTGYEPEEFYQNPRFYLDLVAPAYFEKITAVFQGKLSHGEGEPLMLIHKNGSALWGEINATTLKEDGRPVAVEGIIRDVTRMKDAEIQLRTEKQTRDLFLSSISHELRTPITSIVGYVNALSDGTFSQPDEKDDALQIISEKSLMLEHLINDLFQLSKLENKQFSFAFIHDSALALSKNMIQRHLLDIKTAGIIPLMEIDESALADLDLIVDPQRIDQVLANLLSNAIRHLNPGDSIKLKFSTDPHRSSYVVSISDSGPGIASADLPHLFDRFYKARHAHVQQKEERNNGGSGLGLAISKEIITAHGGEIKVKSIPGKGSTFTFTIPTYRQENLTDPKKEGALS